VVFLTTCPTGRAGSGYWWASVIAPSFDRWA
jgi:hypothetical protein